jgi:hypothetical protein
VQLKLARAELEVSIDAMSVLAVEVLINPSNYLKLNGFCRLVRAGDKARNRIEIL